MDKKWTDDIRRRMNGRKAKAPDHLLDDIKREMALRNLAPMQGDGHKTATLTTWAVRMAAAAAVVLGVLFLWQESESDQRLALQSAPKSETPATANPSSAENPETSLAESQSIRPAGKTEGLKRKKEGPFSKTEGAFSKKEECDNFEKPSETKPSELLAENTAESETGQSDKEETASQPASTTMQAMAESEPRLLASATGNYGKAEKAHERKSHLSIGPFYGGTGGSSASSPAYALADASPIGYYDDAFGSSTSSSYVHSEQLTEKHTDYHQPVKFGLSVRYALTDRWSLQSGLTYSYLSSETTYENGHEWSGKNQQLHYVGVPLSVSYLLMGGKRVNIYASTGFEAETLVSGKQTLRSDNSRTTATQKVRESRPQFSVGGALGAEYLFPSGISAYIEPGISHHFNNGSSIENIYKDKPTNFSLNIGLRVHID